MAMNDLKIDIAEKYLENVAKGIYSRSKAVEEIRPDIKNKASYAYKLWRDKDFRIYLAERTKEIFADKYKFNELADAAMERTKEMLGMQDRTIVAFSPKACIFAKETGAFPDSKEALGFSEVFRKFSSIALEGEDLKAILT